VGARLVNSGYRFPVASIVMLLAALAVVLFALAVRDTGQAPSIGGDLMKKSTTTTQTDKECPPKSVYGVGQKPGKGCGERPPPGQE